VKTFGDDLGIRRYCSLFVPVQVSKIRPDHVMKKQQHFTSFLTACACGGNILAKTHHDFIH
jgi:hypothetical protein